MKLNPDCIRDVLMTIEDATDFSHFVTFDKASDFERLKTYSDDEVRYHIKYCDLSGLLFGVKWMLRGSCLIQYLSPSGHEFLENIRSDTNWNRVKETSKKVGSQSISVLAQIAGQVIAAMLPKP